MAETALVRRHMSTGVDRSPSARPLLQQDRGPGTSMYILVSPASASPERRGVRLLAADLTDIGSRPMLRSTSPVARGNARRAVLRKHRC